MKKNILIKKSKRFKPRKKFYFFLLGLSLIYTTSLLTLYNALHINYVLPLSHLFLFVHIIWFIIVLNIAVNMIRLYRYKPLNCKNSTLKEYPTVSLVTIAYNEPEEVSDLFVEAVAKIDYPRDKLEVIIVEDLKDSAPSNANSFNRLKEKNFDVTYITRNNRDGFRGGALNTVLKNIKSKYVIVLDIDHLPLPNLIKKLVGYVEANPKYDVIMFPQKFRNKGDNAITLAANLGYELDYGVLRKGSSTLNSAFCVGSNWIGRTEKIVEAGGFDETTIVEDLATSLKKWHPKGLKIAMVEDTLAYGLVPDKLESLRKQQHRWAKGSFDLFKDFIKMFDKLTWTQRFSYFFSIIWYLVGFASIISQLFPLATLLGFNFLVVTDVIEYLVIVVNLTFLQVLLFAFPLTLLGYDIFSAFKGQAIGLLVAESYTNALFSSILGRKISFEVTSKIREKEKFHKLLWESKLPLFLALINSFVLVYGLFKWTPLLIITAFWAAYNLAWTLTALYCAGTVALTESSKEAF